MNNKSLYNKNLLLQRTGNDKELIINLFNLFRQTYPKYFKRMYDGIDNRSNTEVRETAHQLKSSVAIFGMEAISSEFAAIETEAINELNFEKMQKRIKLLEDKIITALNQIKDEIQTL